MNETAPLVIWGVLNAAGLIWSAALAWRAVGDTRPPADLALLRQVANANLARYILDLAIYAVFLGALAVVVPFPINDRPLWAVDVQRWLLVAGTLGHLVRTFVSRRLDRLLRARPGDVGEELVEQAEEDQENKG